MEEFGIECEGKGTYPDFCEGDVELMPCPYAHDMYDEIIPVWLCDRHAFERAQDI